MSEKQLLIESCDFSFNCNLSEEKKNALTESLKISAGRHGNLIVRNIPCTILDRRNANGRIYPTALMQKAIEEAKPKMRAKLLVCSASEHPTGCTVEPKDISHCVIDAYIKNVEIEVDGRKEKHNVLFNDWEVLNEKSQVAAHVQQLLLSGFGVGTSIRSLGSCDPDGTVTELEYLGTDLVGQPSSSTYVTSIIGESVEVSAAPLTETFIVSASATNVVHDLDSAVDLSKRIDNANFGTIKKTSTKLDSEVDPKTGAETTMVTLETETEDEVSDIDQALAMAKQAMMNGMADIDSVTIENVKEEQPKESAENSDAPVLNEDDTDPMYKALDKSNYYRFETPEEYMQYINDNKDLLNAEYTLADAEKIFADYTDDKIDASLARHQFEPFVQIISMNNFEMAESKASDNRYIQYIANNAGKLSVKQLQRFNTLCRNFEKGIIGEEDLKVFANSCGLSALDDDEERLAQCAWCGDVLLMSDLKKEKDLGYICNHCAKAIESREGSLNWENEYVPESAMTEDGNENPYVLLGKICQNSTEDSWIQKKARQMANSFEHGEIDQPTFVARLNDMILANDFKLPESTITEAAKKEEDPKTGKHFVLKCPAGFAAMDGNTLVFIDNPKEALHFIVGKEETGLVHLSEVEKILDTMGVYDVEKYYRKDTTDISAPEEKKEEPVKEGFLMGDGGVTQNSNEISGHAIKEDNGSNTRYSAEVKINGANGESSETIPVSAVEIDSINNEIANLYDMKTQKADGQVSITVTDTTSGKQFMFNPESRMIEPLENELMQNESAGELEQNGNKLSMEIDDKNKVEKEFANPAQASIAKAGIEAGKLGGDVLMSEDDDRPQYQDAPDYSDQNIEPGWYAGAQSVGVVGPYKTKEELIADLGEENIKKVDIEYIAPEDLGLAAESAKIDEVMYNEPGEASDPYIEKPMTDAVEQDIVVTANNIDWNNQDLIDVYMNHLEADDPVSFGDIQSKINDLPNTVDIRMSKDELPEDVNIDTLKELVKNKIAKQYVMKVNDLEIADLNSVN